MMNKKSTKTEEEYRGVVPKKTNLHIDPMQKALFFYPSIQFETMEIKITEIIGKWNILVGLLKERK